MFIILCYRASKKRQPFNCPLCEKVVYDLNRHMKTVHKLEKGYRHHFPEIIAARKRKSNVCAHYLKTSIYYEYIFYTCM